ncbi:MAG: hypothetical protein HFJ02_04390 [Bacilli bacterium]|nr:hypothetical protein [Bacilli bacterium]
MKLLYATTNNSKIYNMRRRLQGLPIELITPKELGIKIEVIEDGKTATENAIKKAKAYYQATNMPTIAGDSGLYIENIPEEKQPGLFVRRVKGKELSDDEMIDYYKALIESIGGKSIGYYITGLAMMTEDGLKTVEISEDKFILSSKISNNKHRGNPLDVISIDPVTKKYYTDMTDDEFKNLGHIFDKECVKFIKYNLFYTRKTIKKDELFLRQVSTEVNFGKDDYLEYINVLKNYCRNNAVYALAPVQIGIPKRMIYIRNTTIDMNKNRNKAYDEEIVLINPKILNQKGHTRFLERCASCLDYVGIVDRPYEVEIEYYTIDGLKVHETYEGFKATIFSHEFDHLNGILHIDRALDVTEMTWEETKKQREKRPYEILSKNDEYKLVKKLKMEE